MKKKVLKKDIKRVVREWMERMLKVFETGTSTADDHDIDCPKCGCLRKIHSYHGRDWECQNIRCPFVFPRELRPPSEEELRDYWNRKKLEQKINMFLKSK